MEQKKQTKFIMGKREIGKIILCLIIAIIILTSLKTIATTIIAGSADVIGNEKTIVRTAASVSRGASSSNKVELGTLTTELGRYASTTVTQISSEILQVKFNRTGNIYEINVNIGPTFDVTGTIPYLPAGYTPVENTDLETGFVIEDEDGNQFIWVEVPRTTTVYPTAGTGITAFTSTAYDKIEADLHTYTSTYRDGTTYADTWSSEAATGLTEIEYNTLKKKMLKSVYKNGGFYVGRYETGIESGPKTSGSSSTAPTETAVIKANAYPYNYVTCSQAQTLAEDFATEGYSTSLMFGVQWDLVSKYLETKGATQDELNSDSTNWGNYNNNSYNITNASSKYYTSSTSWASGAYGEKTSNSSILLSTGASDTFSKQNIYDLAGNVYEWTIENTSDTSYPCAVRGGYFYDYGYNYPASVRHSYSTTGYYIFVGFRVCLYKDETDNTKTPTYIPRGYTHIAGDMESGYVIADSNGNEYVWVEVPRTATVYPTAGTSITSFTSTAYDKIEADLHTYTSTYRNGTTYTDTWSSEDATGMTETEYNIQKKKMLKSIYKNGGFYVGRYETGVESGSVVIKQNVAPRGNGIDPSTAQELSESFSTTGYTTSLMFGVQWDLMLKYLENKGTSQDDLVVDSSKWGNYGTSSIINTGSVYEFSKQNIYDIAGNLREYTLEFSGNADYPVSRRGGWYMIGGDEAPVYDRYCLNSDGGYRGESEGFRVVLYTDESLVINRTYNASNLDGNGTTGVATTTLKDLSGNYDATIYGSPTFGNGYISLNEGSATNQYIDMGQIFDLETVTMNIKFSVSDITEHEHGLICNYESGGVGLCIVDGKLALSVWTENGTGYEEARSTFDVQTNTIYDVTGIYDGEYAYLYVNGALEATIETTGGNIKNPSYNENMIIGSNPYENSITPNCTTSMKLYEASISSQVQHPESLKRIYNASNLDGNGTTGVATTTLKDLSGNYDATIYGSPTFGNGYISLNEGSSTNPQYIDIGPIFDLETVTVNIRFSVSEIGTKMYLIGNWDTAGLGLEITTDGKLTWTVYTENGTAYEYFYSNTILQTNTIYDVRAIYDGSQMYLYINGVLEGTLETTGGNIKNPGQIVNMFIGANPSSNATDSDRIDYVDQVAKMKLYSASISSQVQHPESLKRIYNASNLDGNGTTGVATTTLKDLSGNYDATIYGSPTFGNGYISLNEGSSTETQYIDMGPMMDVSKVAVNCKFSVSEIGIVHDLLGNWRSRWIWNEC